MKQTSATTYRARWQLLVVCVLSLGLISTVNRVCYQLSLRFAPATVWVSLTCFSSFLACLAVYLGSRPARLFALPGPVTDWRRIFRLSSLWMMIWLGASALAANHAGHWIAYAHGASAIIAFLIFGPLQEELLFRGAIFELTERAFPQARAFLPVLLSSIFFSLHHFELHGYRATSQALLQVGFTFPMGLVFGILRKESGSLWPALALHFLTNLPGCFGA